MTIGVVQWGAPAYVGGSGASVSTSASGVTAGNTLVVYVTHDTGTGATATCSDNINGAYTLRGSLSSAVSGQKTWVFTKEGVSVGGGGALTFTGSFSPNADGREIAWVEVLAPATFDNFVANNQESAPGTAGGVVSGSVSNSGQPALLLAACHHGSNIDPATVVSGTLVGTTWDFALGGTTQQLTISQQRITSLGSQQATFTAAGGNAGDAYLTFLVILDEAAGGGGSVFLFARRQLPQERSPEERLPQRRPWMLPVSGPVATPFLFSSRRRFEDTIVDERPQSRARRSPESVDNPVFLLWAPFEELQLEERPRRRGFLVPQSVLLLAQAGAGATSLSGAGFRKDAFSPPGAATSESRGAPARTSANTLSSSGRQSDEAHGAAATRTALSPAARTADSPSGASTSARGLTQAGARSWERAGAETISSRLSPSASTGTETRGSTRSFIGLTFTGGASGEVHGRIVLANLLTLSPSSRGSDETHGAAVQRTTFTESGASSGERHGATVSGNVLSVAPSGGASQETHGANATRATLQPPAARSSSPSGAGGTVVAFRLTGGTSGESHGVGTLLTGIHPSPSGAASQETRGAARLLSRLSSSATISRETAGAPRVGAFFSVVCAVAGGSSGELHGAVSLVTAIHFSPAPPSRTGPAMSLAFSAARRGPVRKL